MSAPARFRAVGDQAAARLRKRTEWAFTAAERPLAHEQWITGALAPYRITRPLDAAELYGPDFEQLLALAALTRQSPDSFIARSVV